MAGAAGGGADPEVAAAAAAADSAVAATAVAAAEAAAAAAEALGNAGALRGAPKEGVRCGRVSRPAAAAWSSSSPPASFSSSSSSSAEGMLQTLGRATAEDMDSFLPLVVVVDSGEHGAGRDGLRRAGVTEEADMV